MTNTTSTAAAVLRHAAQNPIRDEVWGGIDIHMTLIASARHRTGDDWSYWAEEATAMLGEYIRVHLEDSDNRSYGEIVTKYGLFTTADAVIVSLVKAADAGQLQYERDQRTAAVQSVIITQLCEDHAAGYYGGPFHFGIGDAARYVAEGHIMPALPALAFTEAVCAARVVLDSNPDMLKRLTKQQKQQKQQARRDAATALIDQAAVQLQAGNVDAALDLVDQAELAAPLLHIQHYTYQQYRDFVQHRDFVAKAREQ